MPRLPDDAGLQARLEAGRKERLVALATYLHHLPVDTANHWELLRCIILDFTALRDSVRAIRGIDAVGRLHEIAED